MGGSNSLFRSVGLRAIKGRYVLLWIFSVREGGVGTVDAAPCGVQVACFLAYLLVPRTQDLDTTPEQRDFDVRSRVEGRVGSGQREGGKGGGLSVLFVLFVSAPNIPDRQPHVVSKCPERVRSALRSEAALDAPRGQPRRAKAW